MARHGWKTASTTDAAGSIWHTQGQGRASRWCSWSARCGPVPSCGASRSSSITDRKDLQKQLSDTAGAVRRDVRIGKRVKQVKALLAEKGPGVVFAMVQKYTQRDAPAATALPMSFRCSTRTSRSSSWWMRPTDRIRTLLHANLMKALPNAARIGFTGTPIIMGDKKRTHEIFGEFIDRYTITQSEEDGATVPILYEGRTAKGAVSDGRDLDQFFDDMFHGEESGGARGDQAQVRHQGQRPGGTKAH